MSPAHPALARKALTRRSSGSSTLRRAPIRFRRLVEQAPDIVYRFGLNPSRVEYVNPAVERLLGLSPDAFYADPDLAFRLADPAQLASGKALPDEAGEVVPATLRWRRLDGRIVALENHPVPVLDRTGRLIAVEGIARDVTARIEAEEALHRTQRELETVVGGAPVIVWALDPAGRVTLARGAGLQAIGRSGEELVGQRLGELGPGASRLQGLLERALRGERFLVDIELADRVFATVVEPVRDEDGAVGGAMGISTDVTAERRLEERTAREQRERAALELALERLAPDLGPDALARAIVAELVTLPDVDRVSVLGFGPRGLVVVLASDGVLVPALMAGQRLPPGRARYLRARARQGAWVEAWEPREFDGTYGLQLTSAGIRAIAFQPLRAGRATSGLLVMSTRQAAGVGALERHLTSFAEAGALVSSRLGPALHERAREEHVRAEINGVISRHRFHPVFQPIVALDDGRVMAHEALTRFEDGTPPERRFAEAAAVGLSADLEQATLAAALEAVRLLPAEMPVMLNVSPGLVLQRDGLRALLEGQERSVTLEISEHEQIDDYAELRAALGTLPGIQWSIDDAGAGFASLRHCIELGPDDIKLDRSLVSGVDHDPARLAAVVGFRHFASQLGARLIAEGVETEAERLALREVGVRFGQGYLFGKPAPVESWLADASRR